MSLVIFSGFLVGILFGFVLQRGYFCHLSGFTEAIMFKNFKIVKATIWAVLIAMLGFHLMASLGIISLNPKPFFWLASIVGGMIFVLGMFLVGACAGGTTFKIGTGLLSYLIAGLGIAIGGLMTAEGFFKPFRELLQGTTKILIAGKTPTLDSIFHLNSWIVVLVLALIFVWLLVKMKEKTESEEEQSLVKKLFKLRWSSALTGIAIGIIGMIAFYTSANSGRNYPLGIVEGYTPILKSFLTGNFKLINWMYMLIPGIISGSVIGSLLSGEFKLRLPKLKQVLTMLIGGFFIGVGAVTMAGCNVTHILSGIPQLSIGSIVSSIVIFGTLYLIVYLKFIRHGSKTS